MRSANFRDVPAP